MSLVTVFRKHCLKPLRTGDKQLVTQPYAPETKGLKVTSPQGAVSIDSQGALPGCLDSSCPWLQLVISPCSQGWPCKLGPSNNRERRFCLPEWFAVAPSHQPAHQLVYHFMTTEESCWFFCMPFLWVSVLGGADLFVTRSLDKKLPYMSCVIYTVRENKPLNI